MSSMGNILKYLGATLAASDTGTKPETGVGADSVSIPGSPAQAGAVPPPSDLPATSGMAQETLSQGLQAAGKLTNQALGAQNKAAASGRAAIKAEFEHAQKVEQALAPEYQSILDKSRAADAHFSDVLAKADAARQEGLNNYLGAVDDLSKTTVYNWWAKADTGAKILGILSQALAGGLQGLQGRGGPTPLDQVIDNDLKFQQMNLAKKSDVARQRGSAYAQLQDQLKDAVVVEAGMRDIALNSAKERLKALAATQGGEANVNYQKSMAELDSLIAKNRQAPLQFYAQAHLDTAKAQAGDALTAASLWGQQVSDQAAAQGKQANDTSYGIVNVPGFEYYSKQAPAEAGALKKVIDSTESAKALIGDLANKIVVRKDGDKTIYKSDNLLSKDDKAGVDQIINQLILKIKDAEKLGVLSESDKQLAEASVGADNGWGARVMRDLGFTSYDAMYKRLQHSVTTLDRDLSTSVGRIVVNTPEGPRRLTYTPDPTK